LEVNTAQPREVRKAHRFHKLRRLYLVLSVLLGAARMACCAVARAARRVFIRARSFSQAPMTRSPSRRSGCVVVVDNPALYRATCSTRLLVSTWSSFSRQTSAPEAMPEHQEQKTTGLVPAAPGRLDDQLSTSPGW